MNPQGIATPTQATYPKPFPGDIAMTCIRNPVGWFEIYVQDMPRARAFYEAVLGVTLEQLGMENPELWAFPAKPDQFGCGGALVHMPGIPSGGNSTLVYFSCDDCDSEAKKAAQAGGMVIAPKFSVGQYGFVAIVQDTEGNRLGLHSMA